MTDVKVPVLDVSGKFRVFKYVRPVTFNVLDPYTTKLCVQIVLNTCKSEVSVKGLFVEFIVDTVKLLMLASITPASDAPGGPVGPAGPMKHS